MTPGTGYIVVVKRPELLRASEPFVQGVFPACLSLGKITHSHTHLSGPQEELLCVRRSYGVWGRKTFTDE